MTIEVLVCRLDGTQVLETRKVPDDMFAQPEPASATSESQTQ